MSAKVTRPMQSRANRSQDLSTWTNVPTSLYRNVATVQIQMAVKADSFRADRLPGAAIKLLSISLRRFLIAYIATANNNISKNNIRNQRKSKDFALIHPLIVEFEIPAIAVQVYPGKTQVPLIKWHILRVQLAQASHRERGGDFAVHVGFRVL